MSAANVKLVVGDVSAGNVVGNHGEAVGAICAGRALDLRAIDQSGGGCRVSGADLRRTGDIDRLTFCRNF